MSLPSPIPSLPFSKSYFFIGTGAEPENNFFLNGSPLVKGAVKSMCQESTAVRNCSTWKLGDRHNENVKINIQVLSSYTLW